MDMHQLEAEVQRLIGYSFIVTSGVSEKGPYLSFNTGRRLLRLWIPRTGVDPKRVAELAKGFMADPQEPAFKEINYERPA